MAEEEGTPATAPAQAAQPQRRGFADAFETFVARGICDSPSTGVQAAAGEEAPEAAAAPESAPAAAVAADAADGAILSPAPAGGDSRAAAEPASAVGSVLGSTGVPEGEKPYGNFKGTPESDTSEKCRGRECHLPYVPS